MYHYFDDEWIELRSERNICTLKSLVLGNPVLKGENQQGVKSTGKVL